jgi:hypothetical protein
MESEARDAQLLLAQEKYSRDATERTSSTRNRSWLQITVRAGPAHPRQRARGRSDRVALDLGELRQPQRERQRQVL